MTLFDGAGATWTRLASAATEAVWSALKNQNLRGNFIYAVDICYKDHLWRLYRDFTGQIAYFDHLFDQNATGSA